MSYRQIPCRPHPDENGRVTSAEDWLGNRFGIGDPVVYCTTASTGGMMAVGTVEEIRLGEQGRRTFPPVEVKIRTHASASSRLRDSGRRSKPGWITSSNVTAIAGLEVAAAKKIQAEA